MSEFLNYFNAEFKNLEPEKMDIKDILSDEMYLICGDFYGIQKFIFEQVSTKSAAKVLRAKSAFIQLFTEVVAKFVCKELNIEEKHILATFAGKFEILSPNFDEAKLNSIKDTINKYFIKSYFGLSGVSIVALKCVKEDFNNSSSYRNLRDKVSKAIENAKFKKLNLAKYDCILQYDNGITNQTLCKMCNIRNAKTKDCCDICSNFINLGKKLVSSSESISSKEINIDFFDVNLKLDEKMKSYVSKDEKNQIVEFETLADRSEGNSALAVLKADVDSMGKFIKNTDITKDFSTFSMFSKSLDAFFSRYIPSKMREKFPNSYVVFAGGDDLFIIGSYDQMIELAIFIREEFKKFTKEKLSISFGIVIAKPSIPVKYLAEIGESMLELSKNIDSKKDAITIFGETSKWDNYIKIRKEILELLNKHSKEFLNSAFLYRLLSFCDMSKNMNEDIKNALWKSKLNYSFNRNIEDKDVREKLLLSFNKNIEKYPKETKMVICEFIYKRRERDA